jgi:hypothetical protein
VPFDVTYVSPVLIYITSSRFHPAFPLEVTETWSRRTKMMKIMFKFIKYVFIVKEYRNVRILICERI